MPPPTLNSEEPEKMDVDRIKSLDLLAEGFTVVRVREAPLPSLQVMHPNYHEVTVYSGSQDPVQDISLIDEMITS